MKTNSVPQTTRRAAPPPAPSPALVAPKFITKADRPACRAIVQNEGGPPRVLALNSQLPKPSTVAVSQPSTINSQPEPLLSKEEVAVHCQVCLRTVDAWMKRGALKFLKIGSRVRFRLSDVDRHLEEFYGTER